MTWEKRLNARQIETLFEPLKASALSDLARLVDSRSFTGDVAGLTAAAAVIADMAGKNGLTLEKIPAGDPSPGACHLMGDDAGDNAFFGIIGHFDTVHPPDSPFSRLTDHGDVLTGPGVQDMKSGIVAAIYGLRVAREALGVERLPVKILFNCDEETGSVDSRPHIERLMKGAKGVFVFEGRNAADGCLVTRRKGIIVGRMTVSGQAAHAGEAPWEGASAIVEAAHKVIALDALTDLDSGVVVTTGKIRGGTVGNQIPDLCTSTIDVRFRTDAQEQALRSAIDAIMAANHVAGCATTHALTTVRPPFVKTPEAGSLAQRYGRAAAEFGLTVGEKEAGGGSDGNLTAAMGIATIDGMGPLGDFPHTDKEYIQKASFFDAVKTFALLLTQLIPVR